MTTDNEACESCASVAECGCDECYRCGRFTKLRAVRDWITEYVCADGNCDENEIERRSEAAYERHCEAYYGGDYALAAEREQRKLEDAGRR